MNNCGSLWAYKIKVWFSPFWPSDKYTWKKHTPTENEKHNERFSWSGRGTSAISTWESSTLNLKYSMWIERTLEKHHSLVTIVKRWLTDAVHRDIGQTHTAYRNAPWTRTWPRLVTDRSRTKLHCSWTEICESKLSKRTLRKHLMRFATASASEACTEKAMGSSRGSFPFNWKSFGLLEILVGPVPWNGTVMNAKPTVWFIAVPRSIISVLYIKISEFWTNNIDRQSMVVGSYSILYSATTQVRHLDSHAS